MTKTKQKMKTPGRQPKSVKRRNIIVVFIKAFSIFLWGMLCWFMTMIYRNSRKNPLGATGIFIFLMLFGFVSYNALFSQKSFHKTPFFETRAQQSQTPYVQNANDASRPVNAQANTSANTVVAETASTQQNIAEQSDANSTNLNVITQTVTASPTAGQTDTHAIDTTSIVTNVSLPTGARVPIPVMMPKRTQAGVSSQAMASASNIGRPLIASQDLMNLQKQMANAGVYSGPIDGLDGPKTRSAIEKWQKRNNAPTQTASMTNSDPIVTNSIASNRAPSASSGASSNVKRANYNGNAGYNGNIGQADIFRVQTGLRLFGYNKVTISGVEDKATQDALKAFQKMFSMPQTGRISPEVIAKMKEIGIFS